MKKHNYKRVLRRISEFTLVFLSLLFIGLLLAWATKPVNAFAPQLTYEDHLYEWVDNLAICESGQDPTKVNWHDGGSPSYGYVQFKEATFDGWNAKLDLPYTFDDIMDREAQRHVAVEIIKYDWKEWKNWYNCHTKYGVGLPPQDE